MTRFKELLFTGEFPPFKGGIANFMYARCLCPPSDGLTVAAAEIAGYEDWDHSSGIDVDRFPYSHGTTLPMRGRQILWAWRALRRKMRQQDYRLITANVLFPFGWVTARMKRPGQRVALFCHGAELLSAQRSLLGRFIFRDTISRMDLLVANSLLTVDIMLSLGCERSRICVIPPPADTHRFHPSVDGSRLREKWVKKDPEGPVLLTVCRLDDFNKGIDTVLEVLPRLRRRFPGIRYVVVGDGPRRKEYEELAHENGVEESVIFAGRVSDDELPECYAACDVFILLSRMIVETAVYEGFGIVYLEAMASAKPVIVSKEAGCRDYVIDGEDCLIVDPRDLEEIFHACVKVLEDPHASALMGKRAAACASKPIDWSALNNFV